MIDPEFAFYGPMGFDLGGVIGNLLMSYLASAGHERAPGERRLFESGCWKRSKTSGWSSPASSSNSGARKLTATPIKKRCSKAMRVRRGWKPNGRPIWRGCSGIPSASRPRKSFAAFSGWRTTSISN